MAQFLRETVRDINTLSLEKIGMGMLTYYSNWTHEELSARFQIIRELGIDEIDIWCCGIPDTWAPFLQRFLLATS